MCNKKYFTSRESGQSLVEVLVALAVATVVIVALIIVVLTSLKNSQFAQNQSKATKYAQEAMDGVLAVRDRDGKVKFNGPPAGLLPMVSSCDIASNTCDFSILWTLYFSAPYDMHQSPCTIWPAGSTATGCYFKLVKTTAGDGTITFSLVEPTTNTPASSIDESLDSGIFSREIYIEDKAAGQTCSTLLCDYTKEKVLTVKVKWTDSSGDHTSYLQTVLTRH